MTVLEMAGILAAVGVVLVLLFGVDGAMMRVESTVGRLWSAITTPIGKLLMSFGVGIEAANMAVGAGMIDPFAVVAALAGIAGALGISGVLDISAVLYLGVGVVAFLLASYVADGEVLG